MLDDAQIESFARDGLLVCRDLVAADLVAVARDELWAHLRDRAIDRDRPETWPRGMVSKLRDVASSNAVQALCTDRVQAIVRDLMDGRPLACFSDDPVQLLVTFPDVDDWQVPAKVWHLDMPRLADDPRVPGVQPFFFMDEVAPGGGGTLVVAGSHNLLNGSGQRIPSAQVKELLVTRHDWFARLMDKTELDRAQFMKPGGVAAEVPVRAVELTGKPGDVIFMDMRALHAPAPNANGQPRMMATARFVDQDLMADIYAG